MKTLLTILLYLWQLPQNLIGLLLQLFYKKQTTVKYKDKTIIVCPSFPGGISLGNTIIVKKYPITKDTWNTVKHEYGHSIQSKYFGWLYLFVIGIPSALHALVEFTDCYYDFYTEKRADKLGNVKR